MDKLPEVQVEQTLQDEGTFGDEERMRGRVDPSRIEGASLRGLRRLMDELDPVHH